MNKRFSLSLLMQILALLISSRAFSFECNLSDPSNRIQSVIEFERCDQNAKAVFSDYKISNFPIILTGLNGDFNSALVVKKGNIIASFKLDKALVFENGLYDFHNPASMYGNVNSQLVEPLSRIGITEVLVWNIGFNFPVEGTALEAWGIKLHLVVMTHEGFHFFGQQLNKIELRWPNQYLGLSEQVRNEMQEKCFLLNDRVKEIVAAEREHILNSFLFSQRGNLNMAKEEATNFVNARYNRYKALENIEVMDPALSPMSCMEMENKASIVEGVPEFIGIGTLLGLNLLAPEQVKDYFSAIDNAFYYRFALFQALIIYSTSPEEIAKTLEEPEAGINRIFKQWVSEGVVQ